MAWVVKNKTAHTIAIPPANKISPNEIKVLYSVSNDFLDQQVSNGYLQIIVDASCNDLTLDNEGWPFSPESCSHVFTADAGGNILTDTATEPMTGVVRVQTFTYASEAAGAAMATKSAWIRQE